MSALQRALPQAAKYLMEVRPGIERWVQYEINACGYGTFGIKTSNTAECNNAWMGVLMRSSDPVTVFFMYMCKLLRLFKKKRQSVARKDPASLVPSAGSVVENS
ncbi:hypothetical protein AaE_012288 [Aphanomyces astaci]|uniref:Uncharacterized protein n=1 Tax=Aphanomyces astaci TaxID=112090 RepID=A0A6A4ZIL8_APHAT|nr:hypothetical protein AaE_012288 [Aphanomyces astaci]